MWYTLSYVSIIISVVFNSFIVKSAYGQSQEFPPTYINDEFLYENWTTHDGLPVNSISSIIQSKNGYIWLGTEDGLVRFDGVRFKIFNNTTHPSLEYNRIKDITTFGEGLLILNNRNEVYSFINGVILKMDTPELLQAIPIFSISELTDESILFKTKESEYLYKDEAYEEVENPLSVSSNLNTVEEYNWTERTGKVHYQGKSVLEIDNRINDVLYDHEGSLWVVSYSKGLYQLKKNIFKVFSLDEGLPNRNIYPIAEGNDGKIWLGTLGTGIASVQGNEVTSGYLFEGISSKNIIQSIISRSNGDIIVAILGKGLFRYSGNKIFVNFDSPISETVNCLYEDSSKRLWAGTNSGLYVLEEELWRRVEDVAIAKTAIKDVIEAPDGSIWIGTNGQGLFHLANDRVYTFDKESGLSSDNIRSLMIIKDTSIDTYVLWVGTEDKGLNRVSVIEGKAIPLNVTKYSVSDGLFDQAIHNIIADDLGLIWMTSNRGVFWVYHYELEEFAKGNLEHINTRGYTELDGLRTREFNGGIQPAGVKSKDGLIWFPSQDGLVRINPARAIQNSELAKVHIEEIVSNQIEITEIPKKIILEEGDRNLTFKFTSLSFSTPENINFEYRLFGFEKDWTFSNDTRTARYTNLNPGTYTFKVIASNSEGLWNLQGDLVYIEIPPHFYEAVWFQVLLIALVITFLACLVLWFKKSSLQIVKEKEKELKERQSEIERLEWKLDQKAKLRKLLMLNLEEDLKRPIMSLQSNVNSPNLKDIVRNDTGVLLHHVDQLLLFARVELEEVFLTPKFENLVEVVSQSISEIISISSEEKVDIVFTTNTRVVNILVEKFYVKIIFKNIIENMSNRSGVTKVRVQVIEESSICTVKISDNGKSYENGEMRKIFNLFKNLEYPVTKKMDIGIALPLAAKLVELHNANIVVHAIPDKGNIFSVVFKKGSNHFELKA